MGCPGSSYHQVWEAVRASSAAPYYLDDFKCGNDRWGPLKPKPSILFSLSNDPGFFLHGLASQQLC